MFAGVAEMNAIEPIAACATVTVPVAVRFWLFALAVAVITSLPLQPVADIGRARGAGLVVTVGLAGVTPVAAIVASP